MSKLYTIWQKYYDGGEWRDWVPTRHGTLSEKDGNKLLALLRKDEAEKRLEFPGTKAIYELREAD